MTHTLRRVLAGTAALSATVLLASCGDDNEDDSNNADGNNTPAEQQEVNELVDKSPNFSDSENRLTEMESEGCGPQFEEWSKDMIVFITWANDGDWEHVQTETNPTTLANNTKACELKVTGANITDTEGGDLNDFTVTTAGLSSESNPIDPKAVMDMREKLEDAPAPDSARPNSGGKLAEITDMQQLAAISPLMASAADFANAKGLTNFSGALNDKSNMAEGFFAGENTWLATITDAAFYTEETEAEPDTQGSRGAWAAVTTDDSQKDTERKSGPAAGQVAEFFTRQMDNSAPSSDQWFVITGSDSYRNV